MGSTNLYKGQMTREDAEERLAGLAGRMGIKPTAIKVRRAKGQGMRLGFVVQGVVVERSCTSQPTIDGNLACLVLWLNDLVINVERGIETFSEAFYNEGARLITATDVKIKVKPYSGTKTVQESLATIQKSLLRLGLSRDQVKVKWADAGREAQIRIKLPSGRVVQKVSVQQVDARRNIAALALWLQVRAKNFERGIEIDMDRLFAANLLPAAKA